MGKGTPENAWQTSMWDCCHRDSCIDLLMCFFLSPLLSNTISYGMLLSKMDKDTCEIALGVILMFCFPEFACCFAGPNRSEIRRKYNLSEEPCQDCCVHFLACCTPCALCQESREVDYHKRSLPVMGDMYGGMPPPPPQ